MPVYEFLCHACGKVTEVWASLEELRKGLAPSCSHCGSRRLVRTFSPVSLSTSPSTSSARDRRCGPRGASGCCGRG